MIHSLRMYIRLCFVWKCHVRHVMMLHRVKAAKELQRAQMFIANTDQGKCLSVRGEMIPVDRKNDRLGSELQRSVSDTIVRVYCHKASRAVTTRPAHAFSHFHYVYYQRQS